MEKYIPSLESEDTQRRFHYVRETKPLNLMPPCHKKEAETHTDSEELSEGVNSWPL